MFVHIDFLQKKQISNFEKKFVIWFLNKRKICQFIRFFSDKIAVVASVVDVVEERSFLQFSERFPLQMGTGELVVLLRVTISFCEKP